MQWVQIKQATDFKIPPQFYSAVKRAFNGEGIQLGGSVGIKFSYFGLLILLYHVLYLSSNARFHRILLRRSTCN